MIEIKSPPRVMMESGQSALQGFINGIKAYERKMMFDKAFVCATMAGMIIGLIGYVVAQVIKINNTKKEVKT